METEVAMLKKLFCYLIWDLLDLPALANGASVFGSDARALHGAIGESGQWADRADGVSDLVLPCQTAPADGGSVTKKAPGWGPSALSSITSSR
jgi:hypothetical protein